MLGIVFVVGDTVVDEIGKESFLFYVVYVLLGKID